MRACSVCIRRLNYVQFGQTIVCYKNEIRKMFIRPYFFLYLVYGFFFKILRSEEGKK